MGWAAQSSPLRRRLLLRQVLHDAEHGFVVLALFVISSAITPLIERMSGLTIEYAGGDALTQALLTPVYLGALVLALARDQGRQVLLVAMRHPWSIALCVLALLSAAWSDVPPLAARRGLALC